jgi:hypothetical protein
MGLLGLFKSLRPVGEPCESGMNLINQALVPHTKIRRTVSLGYGDCELNTGKLKLQLSLYKRWKHDWF